MEWVDFSKGLGTNREVPQSDGFTRGNISDETGIRAAHQRWKELMSSDVSTCVVTANALKNTGMAGGY